MRAIKELCTLKVIEAYMDELKEQGFYPVEQGIWLYENWERIQGTIEAVYKSALGHLEHLGDKHYVDRAMEDNGDLFLLDGKPFFSFIEREDD